jgi:peptidoglycan/LPS O-acetylase OafA/YrhL
VTAASKIGRDSHLDGLRGVAAIVVVATHSLAAFRPHLVFGTPTDWSSWLFLRTPLAILTNGFGAVAVFFMLSGFVLTKKYFVCTPSLGMFAEDVSKRFVRLYLVAFPASLAAVTLMLAGIYCNAAAALVSQSDWLGHLRTASSPRDVVRLIGSPLASISGDFIVVGWTLWVELWASYVLFLVVLSLFALPRSSRALAYASLFVFARIGLGEPSQVGWLSYFILGMAVADNESLIKAFLERIGRRLRLVIFGGLLATLATFACIPSYAWAEGDHVLPRWACKAASIPFVSGPSGLAGVVAFLLVVLWRPARRVMSLRPMLYLGHISVGLYLVHIPIICSASSGLAVWCQQLPASTINAAMWGIAIATVVISIFVGHVYSQVFDQLAIYWSRRVGKFVRANVEAL